MKPWSIPDRWDDQSPIAGYRGEPPARQNWRNNSHWDGERFTDSNGNRLWDPGEPYQDTNANATYDQELYDPTVTGYVAGPSNPPNLMNGNLGDVGLGFVLKPSSPSGPHPGQYFIVSHPPVNRGTPVTGVDQYRWNIANCDSGTIAADDILLLEPGAMLAETDAEMIALLQRDPAAHWNSTTRTVEGSAFPQSPRVVLISVHDPRIAIQSGNNTVIVTKTLAFFIENRGGTAQMTGRLLLARAPGGVACAADAPPSFTYDCVTATTPTTWGRIKHHYRD